MAARGGAVGARARYLRRVLGVYLSHPVEAYDRTVQRLELRRFGADQRIDYGPRDDWEEALHHELGAPWPCPDEDEYRRIFGELERTLDGFPREQDADPAFARAVFCVARHAGVTTAIETGVARGITSRYLLEAMSLNGHGELWSIDLPLIMESFHDKVGAAVTPQLRSRWHYVRGSTRRRLRPLLARLGPVDLFVHDTIGTPLHVEFELETAWRGLRPGGWLVADAINRSTGFAGFLERHAPPTVLIGRAGPKRHVVGQFAIVPKPA